MKKLKQHDMYIPLLFDLVQEPRSGLHVLCTGIVHNQAVTVKNAIN